MLDCNVTTYCFTSMKIRLTASVLKDSDNLAVHAGFTRENLKPFVLPSRFFLNTRVNMNDHLVTQSIREFLMKLLHALVGYLVIRVTAPSLPFLAFTSPLAAMHYDGYVNTTQNYVYGALMKQVLGIIIKTC